MQHPVANLRAAEYIQCRIVFCFNSHTHTGIPCIGLIERTSAKTVLY